jgi:purine-binding chemotaxis protein CheW
MPTNHQYCTFYLGEQCYGLDVLVVQEVVRSQPLTRVPLAHPMVRGLMNLRGQIVTAVDLRRRLDLPARDDQREPVNIIVQTDDGAVALLVDEVGEVLEVPEQQFERPPATLIGSASDVVQGAYKLPDRLLVILDPRRVVSIPGPADGKTS